MGWNILFLLGGSVALATACKVQLYVQTCKYFVFRWYNHDPDSLKQNFSSPEPNAMVTPSRKSLSRKSHLKQFFLRNRVGRGYLVTVTGSISLILGLRACYGVSMSGYIFRKLFAWLIELLSSVPVRLASCGVCKLFTFYSSLKHMDRIYKKSTAGMIPEKKI